MSEISKEVWKDVLAVLKKHKISYTTHLESRDITMSMGECEKTVQDRHIHTDRKQTCGCLGFGEGRTKRDC